MLVACEILEKAKFKITFFSSINNFISLPVEGGRWKVEREVAQSCPTLCNPVDCSLPGSSVQGILQARILEWIAISFSRGSSWPRDWTQVSRIGGRCFNLWATRDNSYRVFLPAMMSHTHGIFWTWLITHSHVDFFFRQNASAVSSLFTL